jgi:hypothetical protein
VFTARYALSPYIKQIRFVFKGLRMNVTEASCLKCNSDTCLSTAVTPSALAPYDSKATGTYGALAGIIVTRLYP